MNLSNSLDNFNLLYSEVLAGVTLIAQIYVAIRTRLNLEWSMILISITYLVSFGLRIYDDHSLNTPLLFGTATIVQWAVLYLFVY